MVVNAVERRHHVIHITYAVINHFLKLVLFVENYDLVRSK